MILVQTTLQRESLVPSRQCIVILCVAFNGSMLGYLVAVIEVLFTIRESVYQQLQLYCDPTTLSHHGLAVNCIA